MKSLETLMYDLPFCTNGIIWKFKSADTSSLGVQQFEITGLPEALDKF